MNFTSTLSPQTPTPLNSNFLATTASLIIATSIIGVWICHLSFWLSREVATVHFFVGVGAFWVQVFLNTGLFITAHDAIHGLICPPNRAVNSAFGIACTTIYACLSYETLVQNHQLHHQYPMSSVDPDFLDYEKAGFILCYLQFIRQYWGWKSFLQLASILCGLMGLLHTSLFNLIVFWALPLFMSSLQLFYFGTYRPHQCCDVEPDSSRIRCALSQPKPWLLSLLSCYHFSYHYEHHAHPNVPWWQLPGCYVADETQQNSKSGY